MKIEFQNSIRRLSFLCGIWDIKIAWINPCTDSIILHSATTVVIVFFSFPAQSSYRWNTLSTLLFVLLGLLQPPTFHLFPSSVFLSLASVTFHGFSLHPFSSLTVNVMAFPWSSSFSPLGLFPSFFCLLVESVLLPQHLVIFHCSFLHASSGSMFPYLHNLHY